MNISNINGDLTVTVVVSSDIARIFDDNQSQYSLDLTQRFIRLLTTSNDSLVRIHQAGIRLGEKDLDIRNSHRSWKSSSVRGRRNPRTGICLVFDFLVGLAFVVRSSL
jgi:hypothetical protein